VRIRAITSQASTRQGRSIWDRAISAPINAVGSQFKAGLCASLPRLPQPVLKLIFCIKKLLSLVLSLSVHLFWRSRSEAGPTNDPTNNVLPTTGSPLIGRRRVLQYYMKLSIASRVANNPPTEVNLLFDPAPPLAGTGDTVAVLTALVCWLTAVELTARLKVAVLTALVCWLTAGVPPARLKTAGRVALGFAADPIPVVVKSTWTVNGVGAQPTSLIPVISASWAVAQYGDAKFVHFLTKVLLAQPLPHSPRSEYGTQSVTTGHPSGTTLVPEKDAEAQHPNQE